MTCPRRRSAVLFLVLVAIHGVNAQEANQPPNGFEAVFDGRTLDGWHGGHFTPKQMAEMSAKERADKRAEDMVDMKLHWTVEDGDLVNDGDGVYLTTDNDFEDFELWVDYKTVPQADSGVYLRGNPQVQIWDYTEAGGKWNIGADKGSGGLWNNSAGAVGKDPAVRADKAFGEWNRLRVVQVGARTSVWLNGWQVVDHAIMENYWDRTRAHYRTGPIQLQTHGGEIRWKNIFVREIGSEEANRVLAAHGEDPGFETVFNGRDLSGWKGPTDNYVVNDGEVTCKPGKGGTIYTEREYGDFVVRLEFKSPPGGNNGLAIRYPGSGDTAYAGMCELQVLDTGYQGKLDPRQVHGSAYGMVGATTGYLRPAGEWNFQEVTVKGSTIRVELNGSVILDTDLAKVTEFMGGSPHPGKDRTSGHFGFAGHSDPVTYRRVRIKSIDGEHNTATLDAAKLGATPNVHRLGNIFLAGQPNQADITALKEAGIQHVLDLRTEGEIEWDEPAVMKQAGIHYERLAFRSPDSLKDDVFDRAREVFASTSSGGRTLCHCGSANRVGAVWLAHRVLDQGITWDEALLEAKAVGLRTPGYIDRAKEYVEGHAK